MVPLQVKGLESLTLNQYMVLLLKVGDKGLQVHRVPIGALQPDKMKDLNAHTVTKIVMVLADE